MDPFNGAAPGSSPEFLVAAIIVGAVGLAVSIAIVLLFVRLSRRTVDAPAENARPRSARIAQAQPALSPLNDLQRATDIELGSAT